jgi:hypothetical protein
MVNVKRLESIEIEGTTKEEVQELINNYLKMDYTLEQKIYLSDDESDKYPYFAYVQKDEFGNGFSGLESECWNKDCNNNKMEGHIACKQCHERVVNKTPNNKAKG